jgi:trans-aconitate 2-methyltransferase
VADWNAAAYARVSAPQLAWGQKVLARLPLAGDEVVLDAGCGAGRLTEEVMERLPRGCVVALDASEAMLAQATTRLARFGDRVRFVRADAATHVEAPPVDAVFSTATFHWVLDHDRLFASVHASLKPGGRLVSQFGGGRNLARVRARAEALRRSAPYARWFEGFREPWLYATAEETRDRLVASGFVEVSAGLEEAPVRFDDAAPYREFVTHVIFRDDLARLPDDAARDGYLGALVEQAGREDPPYVLDYVRLNADARRP